MFKNKEKRVTKLKLVIAVFGLLQAAVVGATTVDLDCFADDGSCSIAGTGFAHKGFDFPDIDSIINGASARINEAARQEHWPVFQNFPRFLVDEERKGKGKKLHGTLYEASDMPADGLLMGFYGRDMAHENHFRKRFTHPRRHHGHHMPPVPVPATVWLFGSGLLLLAGVIRRRS